MDEKVEVIEKKDKKSNYLKWLLIRIIFCCIIFLIFFIANLTEFKIQDLDTQKVISLVSDNNVIETVEKFLSNLIKSK